MRPKRWKVAEGKWMVEANEINNVKMKLDMDDLIVNGKQDFPHTCSRDLGIYIQEPT